MVLMSGQKIPSMCKHLQCNSEQSSLAMSQVSHWQERRMSTIIQKDDKIVLLSNFSMRLGFLQILQPKQHSARDWMQAGKRNLLSAIKPDRW